VVRQLIGYRDVQTQAVTREGNKTTDRQKDRQFDMEAGGHRGRKRENRMLR
jgi:hypothetical protein